MQHFLNTFLFEIEIQYQESIAALNDVANEKHQELTELWDLHREHDEKCTQKIQLDHFPQYKSLIGMQIGKENKGQDGNVTNEKGGKMEEETKGGKNKENDSIHKNGQVIMKRRVASKISTRRLQVLKDTKNIPAKMFTQTKALDFIIHNAKPEQQWKAAKKQQKINQQKQSKYKQQREYIQKESEQYKKEINYQREQQGNGHREERVVTDKRQHSHKTQEHMYRSRSNTPHSGYEHMTPPHQPSMNVRYNNYTTAQINKSAVLYHQQQRQKLYKEGHHQVTPNRYRFKTPTYPVEHAYIQNAGRTPEEQQMLRSVTPPTGMMADHSNNSMYALNREKRHREQEYISHTDRRPSQKTRVTPPTAYATPEPPKYRQPQQPQQHQMNVSSSAHYMNHHHRQQHQQAPQTHMNSADHRHTSTPNSYAHHHHHHSNASTHSSSSQSRRQASEKSHERQIVHWARDENLIKLMKEQFERNVDPERIFGPAPEHCNLEEMFPSLK